MRKVSENSYSVTSACDKNVKYQIWSFSFNLFLNYDDNKYTVSHIDTQTGMHTHTFAPLNMSFSDFGTSKGLNPSKFPFWKFYPKIILSQPYMGKRK